MIPPPEEARGNRGLFFLLVFIVAFYGPLLIWMHA